MQDPSMQPINVLTNTRLVNTKLEKTFYKEMDPFMKEDMLWSIFVWRISGNLGAPKYINPVAKEDDFLLVKRVIEDQSKQLVQND